jgi:hypothetical protein
MQIAVLGPLDVSTDDGRPMRVSGAQERLLLAVLVAGAPDAVSTERLIEGVWDGRSPESADEALSVRISSLRHCLEPRLPPHSSGRYVVRRGTGYLLAVAGTDIDALRMRTLVDRGSARLAAGDAAEAARLLAAALRLWRGDPYADWPDAAFARDERRRLAALRAAAEAGLQQARRDVAGHTNGRPPRTGVLRPPTVAAGAFARPGDPIPPAAVGQARPDGEEAAPSGSDMYPEPRPAGGADAEQGNRRVRILLLGGVLVAALVVAGLAVRSVRLAEDAVAADREAATLALAERLAARSTTGPLDLSLLLAVQAVRLAETSETRGRLVALLAEHPRVERVGRFHGFPRDAALSDQGRTVSFRTEGELVAWSIGADTQPGVMLDVPEEWGAWRSTSPFPLESTVLGAGLLDGVPWLRTVSAVDGSSRLILDGDAIGGVPVAGAARPDGSRFLVLVAEPDAAAPISSRWRVIEVDPFAGTRQDTGISGTFPAPPLALVADFARDAGSFVLWGEGGGDTALRVDVDGGQTPLQVSSRPSRSPALRVFPSGVAQLWTDGVVTVLDRSGTPIQELDAHGSAVYDVAFSPDGAWAVSAGAGGELVLWGVDPSTGRWSERERLPGHAGGVVGAEVDPSGSNLVTVAEDETVISWDLSTLAAPPLSSMDTSVLLDRACAIVARDFTPAEWEHYLPDRSYAPTCTDLP